MIHPLSIPVIVMAVLTMTIGLFYFYLFVKRRRKDELAFSIFCFSTVLYDIFSAFLYSTHSVEQGVFWQRHQFTAIVMMSISAIWFVIHYGGYGDLNPKVKRIPLALTIVFTAFALIIMNVDNRYTLTAANPAVKTFIFLGRTFTYYEGDPGILYVVEYSIVLMSYIIILWHIIHRYRQGNRNLKPLLIAFSFFLFAVINDMLVGVGIYNFFYLVEYAFLFIIISMSYILLNRFISLYNRVSEMNLVLEEKVLARTEKLRQTMEEMEYINDSLIKTNQLLEDSQRAARSDMYMAGNVQKKIMPAEPPLLSSWDIDFIYLSLTGVSGDFFDLYSSKGSLQGVSMFDVSGHGVSSGLITLLAKSMIFRLFAEYRDKGLKIVIENFNRELKKEISGVEHFLSGIMLKMGPENDNSQQIEYVNAGHPDIFIKKKSTGEVFQIKPSDREMKGLLLGLEGIDGEFDTYTFTVQQGDILFLFTDGIKESLNLKRAEYGLANIKKSIENAGGTAEEICSSVIKDFYEFMEGGPLNDDITIIVMRKL